MTAYNIIVDRKRYCFTWDKQQAKNILSALIKNGKNASIQEIIVK